MTRPRKKSWRKRDSNPGPSALEVDAICMLMGPEATMKRQQQQFQRYIDKVNTCPPAARTLSTFTLTYTQDTVDLYTHSHSGHCRPLHSLTLRTLSTFTLTHTQDTVDLYTHSHSGHCRPLHPLTVRTLSTFTLTHTQDTVDLYTHSHSGHCRPLHSLTLRAPTLCNPQVRVFQGLRPAATHSESLHCLKALCVRGCIV